jgi:hypothetical protein
MCDAHLDQIKDGFHHNFECLARIYGAVGISYRCLVENEVTAPDHLVDHTRSQRPTGNTAMLETSNRETAIAPSPRRFQRVKSRTNPNPSSNIS